MPKQLTEAVDAALDARGIIVHAANKFDAGTMDVETFSVELAVAQKYIAKARKHLQDHLSGLNQLTLPV